MSKQGEDVQYYVMDERAMYDTDRAVVFTCAYDLTEARDDAEDFRPCVIVDKDFKFVDYVGLKDRFSSHKAQSKSNNKEN